MAYQSAHYTHQCSECGAMGESHSDIDHYSRCSKFNSRRNMYSPTSFNTHPNQSSLSEEDVQRIATRISQILGK